MDLWIYSPGQKEIEERRIGVKKIPTIFKRDMSKKPALVMNEITLGCEWVFAGEGVPTIKRDGTCCMVRNGKLYKRYELNHGKTPPLNFEPAQEPDPITGDIPGWVPVGDGPEDQYHREALHNTLSSELQDGTFELMGPKIQGNPERWNKHHLWPHGFLLAADQPDNLTFDSIRVWFATALWEGIVWHHPDGRMAKIKRRDFGFEWPIKDMDDEQINAAQK